MGTQQIILLAINIIGGAAVIGSYVYGLRTYPEGAGALWGGVPASIRPVYGISMILAALGYFAFIYFILFRLVPGDVIIAGRFSYSLFYAIFLAVLIPSVFWMPFTHAYIGSSSNGIWLGIHTVLALVGIASIALVWALLSLNTKIPTVPYWFAVAGSAYFAFHTTILDAIIWPVLFNK